MSEPTSGPVMPKVDGPARPWAREIPRLPPNAYLNRRWPSPRPVPILAAIGVALEGLRRIYVNGEITLNNWDFYVAMAMAAGVVLYFLGPSPDDPLEPQPKCDHPDPNVAALIDGKIDLAEYARRSAGAKREDGG